MPSPSSLADAGAASREMGFDLGPLNLIAVENTDTIHNMIVCTLCSCYPRNLLGLPPDWYKTREYRSRAVREPRGVLAEFGVELSDDIEVRVAIDRESGAYEAFRQWEAIDKQAFADELEVEERAAASAGTRPL